EDAVNSHYIYKYFDWNTRSVVNYYTKCEVEQSFPEGYRSTDSLGVDAYGRTFNYDWATDTYYKWQEGSEVWYAASKEAIAYFMDPRNFLDEVHVFMFENDAYNGQSLEMLQHLLKNTFMDNAVLTDNGAGGRSISMTYAELFYWIGNYYNINPMMLARRVMSEHYGNSPLITGNYPGFEGLYNFFNMGASDYANRSDAIIWNGFMEAQNGNSMILPNGETYTGPWNSKIRALVGGAAKIKQKYIDNQQDTIYLQRFCVQSGFVFSEYMQNVLAPYTESEGIYKTYSELGFLDNAMVFKIPVFENMNASNPSPAGNKNPNNYLRSLQVNGTELITAFDPGTNSFFAVISPYEKTASVTAAAASAKATVSGTGTLSADGTKTHTITVTAENGQQRQYILTLSNGKPEPAWADPVNAITAFCEKRSYISINWETAANAEGYRIYRTDETGSRELIADTQETYFHDTAIQKNRMYSYSVSSYLTYDHELRETVSAVSDTAILLSGPDAIYVECDPEGISLSWEPVAHADGYSILRREGNGPFIYTGYTAS
ncbi:MAG: hypothetical protein IKN57_05750, partial [Parasporobacterium sp.]|nr:hypothetical protein [Parasporobacterium sp.]